MLRLCVGTLMGGALLGPGSACLRAAEDWASLERSFQGSVRRLVEEACHECHAGEKTKGDVDLGQYRSVTDVRRDSKVWEGVLEQLESGEMPPKKAKPLAAEDRAALVSWVRGFLDTAANERAGDPGPVVLRRLSNAEYTYSVQDLTGLALQPAREFPADGAAGEGFMNAGQALVMSSALFGKYLDAAKGIAAHVVLLPDGFRFSEGTTRRDWSDEAVAAIRRFYAQYADGEGRLPVEASLRALLEWRERPSEGRPTLAAFAAERKLNARYLLGLQGALSGEGKGGWPAGWTERWATAKSTEAASLAADVAAWQKALWKVGTVGYMKPWMSPAQPVVYERELKWSAPKESASGGADVVVRWVVTEAGDGAAGDLVLWEQPRLKVPGREPLDLKEVRAWWAESRAWRTHLASQAAASLEAAVSASASQGPGGDGELARTRGISVESLRVWKAFLGIGDAPVALEGHLGPEIRGVGGQAEVSGWGRAETPNMVANPTDRALRIPGNLKAKGVAMHPSPTHAVAVGWRSPVSARVRVTSAVAHAHPECGNGVTWSLEVRQGATRRRLKQGVSAGGGPAKTAEVSGLDLHIGDVVSLLIGPRDGNHSCDLTDVDLVIETESEAGAGVAVPRWSLTADVASEVLAGNPHADRQGNPGVWHFYAESVQGGDSGWTVPEGSILARWHAAEAGPERDRLAQAFQGLLIADSLVEATPAADRRLRDEILSLHGPLLSSVRRLGLKLPQGTTPDAGAEAYGLDPARFGRDPEGNEVEGRSLAVRAPSVVEVRFPAEVVAGAELVTTARLDPVRGREGTVQVQLTSGTVTERQRLQAGEPILVHPGSGAESRVSAGMETLRQWFPAAVCYPRVVPVDEVVTLALYHREDESLKRLMLDDAGRVAIDRLWDELHFISHDALGLVDAFQQLMEYATQDSNPALFEPMRKPIMEGAETFRARLRSAEPAHWEALLRFVERAYRRPLDDAGRAGLRTLYDRLRASDLPPDEAFRSVMARVLVSPAFLYRPEVPGPARESVPISDWEQATRLSYFLWSTVPDDALRAAAAAGRLREPAGLLAEARRMLRDPKVRRLAVEFGCQWLHIHGFDELDEKSERHFPEFATVRGPMYEEAIRFFTDFFAEDRSVLELIDSDHAFLNETVAKHYGVPGVVGAEWRRVGGMRAVGRGGVLGLGATLAKQSGASRTSPILRGNWVAEVLLGFKLPKPPKNVPPLPEDENATEGLTLRQVVERHSSVPECAGCHRHIDAYGFALEGFDAVGRARERDAADRTIDTFVALPDGTRVSGAGGLRRYLLEQRREVFVAQFCRKLLGYALGRGVRLSDKPLLAEMQSQLVGHEYRISAALEVLLVSRQFREIRGAAVADEP